MSITGICEKCGEPIYESGKCRQCGTILYREVRPTTADNIREASGIEMHILLLIVYLISAMVMLGIGWIADIDRLMTKCIGVSTGLFFVIGGLISIFTRTSLVGRTTQERKRDYKNAEDMETEDLFVLTTGWKAYVVGGVQMLIGLSILTMIILAEIGYINAPAWDNFTLRYLFR
ncbi:MAG: hypothetical protein HJJLKODD_00756 [Phycisphaerae bacterium]|nr:hypothetical protein [Phycisphaerae bacterium]